MPLTTVMDHVARLERKGHVSRMPDPGDRRATRVVLTADGLAAHRAANARFERAYAEFERHLTVDQEAVQSNLALLRSAIDDAAREAPRAPKPSARRPAGVAPRPAHSRA
jgi:DNA-binding MarR family transcriptional regulator